jgi:hypothetical protein
MAILALSIGICIFGIAALDSSRTCDNAFHHGHELGHDVLPWHREAHATTKGAYP